MIKDKTDQREKPRDVPERPAVSLPEEVQQNALAEMYLAVRRALQTIASGKMICGARLFSRP